MTSIDLLILFHYPIIFIVALLVKLLILFCSFCLVFFFGLGTESTDSSSSFVDSFWVRQGIHFEIFGVNLRMLRFKLSLKRLELLNWLLFIPVFSNIVVEKLI